MHPSQMSLGERLRRIREIGQEIADLQNESLGLRQSMLDDHEKLPRSSLKQNTAVAILGDTVCYLTPKSVVAGEGPEDCSVVFDDAARVNAP